MRFRVLGRFFRQRACLFNAELHPQRLHDASRHVALKSENVLHVAVIVLRPEMKAIGHVDKLRGNSQLVAGLAHTAFQHRAHVQLLADLPENAFVVLPLEGKGGTASRHAQSFHFGQHVEQFFGHSVAEIFVRFVCAHVHERQHGDRFLVGAAGGRGELGRSITLWIGSLFRCLTPLLKQPPAHGSQG